MIRITSGKGFHLRFPNGYTASVQFGPGNYSDNYNMSVHADDAEAGNRGSSTVEVAAFGPDNELVPIPEASDTVQGYVPTSKLLEFLGWVATL